MRITSGNSQGSLAPGADTLDRVLAALGRTPEEPTGGTAC
jgi:hypothetical protein